MNIIERLIAWLEWNKRPCEERDLLNDALEELTSLTARLAEAEAAATTARTAARYLADALLHGGDGRHYMQALAFWPWIQTVVVTEAAKGGWDE